MEVHDHTIDCITSTVENQRVSIPFVLEDNNGDYLSTVPAHSANEFSRVMEMVWQENALGRVPAGAGHHCWGAWDS